MKYFDPSWGRWFNFSFNVSLLLLIKANNVSKTDQNNVIIRRYCATRKHRVNLIHRKSAQKKHNSAASYNVDASSKKRSICVRCRINIFNCFCCCECFVRLLLIAFINLHYNTGNECFIVAEIPMLFKLKILVSDLHRPWLQMSEKIIS